jgi:hypothetical protein
MTSLIVSLIAAARFILLTTTLVGSDRQVLLVDAYSFGLTYDGAKINLATCIKHHQAMMWEVPDAIRDVWNQSMWVRRNRWAMLVNALDEKLQAVDRLERLNELRESLGTREFFAGRMVAAIPAYGD